MEEQIESTLGKYLEFKIFELFKNRLINTIQPHCRQGSKKDVYQHLFLCPSQLSKKRNFQLKGVLSPFVCFWRTSLINWNDKNEFYSRSVLARDFMYQSKDGIACEHGFLYDLQFDFEIFSSSYYRDFRDRINQDLLDTDRLRYFDVDVRELLKDCIENVNTKVEVKLNGMTPSDNVDAQNNRSFDLNAKYTVRITIPYCRSFDYIEGVRLYLNDNLIYQKETSDTQE